MFQSMGSQRVGHNWVTEQQQISKQMEKENTTKQGKNQNQVQHKRENANSQGTREEKIYLTSVNENNQ